MARTEQALGQRAVGRVYLAGCGQIMKSLHACSVGIWSGKEDTLRISILMHGINLIVVDTKGPQEDPGVTLIYI
jgi:hypothetical protein